MVKLMPVHRINQAVNWEPHFSRPRAPAPKLRAGNYETFEKCSILVKNKEGENFNHRNILNISRIEI